MFFKKKRKKEVESNDNKIQSGDIELFILVEKPMPGLQSYASRQGLPIKEVLYDIEEAKIKAIMSPDKMRLIVIEKGLGKFLSTSAREELIDLFGMFDGKDKMISMFYTDKALKNEIKQALGKKNKISWEEFKSTTSAIYSVISLGEKYNIEDIDLSEQVVSVMKIIRFKGRKVELKIDTEEDNETYQSSEMNLTFNVHSIIGENKGESLRAYKVKF